MTAHAQTSQDSAFGQPVSGFTVPSAAAPLSSGAVTSRSAGGSFISPDGILGLPMPKGLRKTVSFNEAMGLTLHHSFDLQIARERMFQTELLVRKAWSVVLPRLTANVAYNFSWPEVQFQPISQEQLDEGAAVQRSALEQQALIYQAQAEANRADGDYNSAYANQAIANQLRAQSGGIEAGQAPDPVTIQPAHTLSGGVSFSVVLFNGRSIPLLLNAYDTVKQTRYTLSRARTQALYLAALGYFNAVAAQRLGVIAEAQLRNLSKHLDVTRVRVEVGSLPRLALRRVEADIARARANLRSVHNAYESSVSSLAMMLGMQEAFDVGGLPAIPDVEMSASPDELVSRALSTRPDVAAARMGVQIAERQQVDALARWFPTVSLNGNARASSNVRGFQKDPITYSVLVNAAIPLYDGGERYNAWREAGSLLREARLQLAQQVQRLELSVRGNVREVEVRKLNLETQQESLQLAEAAARDARARFEVGAATQLEVLDAEHLMISASLDLAQAQLELQMARLALSFVLGAFDPVVAPVTSQVSPVDGKKLPPPSRKEAATPGVPVLAPAARAARAGPDALPLQPTAFDILRAGFTAEPPPE
jgi:outer membrane protein